MKVVPYTMRNEVYELEEDYNLPYYHDGIMVMTNTVRVIMREKATDKGSTLIIEIPNKEVKISKHINKNGAVVYYLNKKKSSTCRKEIE